MKRLFSWIKKPVSWSFFLRRHLKHLGPLSGLRFAIAYTFRPSNTLITVPRRANRAPLTLRARSSDIHVYEDTFLWDHYALPYPDTPTVIIDAGAHIGLAAIQFAQRFPQATIYALEPHPDNFALLKENVEAYHNIHPIHAALWPTEGSLQITNPEANTWSFQCRASDEGDIPATSIPALMAKHQLSHIDLLKIDIEGAEKDLFSQETRWLENVTSLVVELHDDLVPGCSRAFYQATPAFPHEARNQENLLVSRQPLR